MAKIKKKLSKGLKLDPEKLLKLDDATLEDDIRGLPLSYHYIQVKRNQVLKEVRSLTIKKQRMRGEIFISEKSSVLYDKTPTDKYVEAIIHDTDDYMDLKKTIVEKEAELADLEALVSSMEIKAKLVQTLSSNLRAMS
jgi:hypothetical protein